MKYVVAVFVGIYFSPYLRTDNKFLEFVKMWILYRGK